VTEQHPPPFLVLSDQALAGLGLSMVKIVDAIEQTILAEARGQILTSPKSGVERDDGRYVMTTLASGDAPNLTIVKSVIASPRNPDRGLPGVDGAILVQDSETGQLLAVMQAGWITGIRTAGLSGVVARRLANPQSQQVAFIGAGVQARSHLEVYAALFPLTGITVFGRGQGNIERLCAMARDRGLTARICETPRAAVQGADLVVSSVTRSFDGDPFVDARWLKPGVFASIADLALPWVPDSLAAFGALYIDSIAQEHASPRKLLPFDLVTGDLAALLDETAPLPSDRAVRRAFVFRGLAIGDFALARLALGQARTVAAGQSISW